MSKFRVSGVGLPGTAPSPYLSLADSIGSPAVNEVRKTAQMAKTAARAPRAPRAPKSGIRKIRARKSFALPPQNQF